MDTIKSRIKQLRKDNELTMAEFAKSIGVSAGNVGDWESESRKSVPGASALIAIANTYHVSIDWILLGIENEQQCSYSEYIKPQYASDSIVFEEIIELMLRLEKIELYQVLDFVKGITLDYQQVTAN